MKTCWIVRHGNCFGSDSLVLLSRVTLLRSPDKKLKKLANAMKIEVVIISLESMFIDHGFLQHSDGSAGEELHMISHLPDSETIETERHHEFWAW